MRLGDMGSCPLCDRDISLLQVISKVPCCGQIYHYPCYCSCSCVLNFLEINVRHHQYTHEGKKMVYLSDDHLRRIGFFGVKCPEADCEGFGLYRRTPHYFLGSVVCPRFLLPDIPMDKFRTFKGLTTCLDFVSTCGNGMAVSGPDHPRKDAMISGIRSLYDYADSADFHQIVHEMCDRILDDHQRLYCMYIAAFEEYIQQRGLPALENCLTMDGEFMLQEFVACWQRYGKLVKTMSGVFRTLQHFLVLKTYIPSLVKVAKDCFRNEAFIVADPCKAVGNAVAALINKEREGEVIDRALLTTVMDVFDQMGFIRNLETCLLQKSREYYSTISSRWISEYSCLVFTNKAAEFLRREIDSISFYIRTDGLKHKLEEIVKHELFEVHATQLLANESDGCLALLRNHKLDDIRTLYELFREFPGALSDFIMWFEEYVASDVLSLIQQAKDATSRQAVIQNLGKLYDRCVTYVNDVFVNPNFHQAIRDGFQRVGQIDEATTELYVQQLEMGNDESDDKILKQVAYMPGKSQFAELYEHRLAKRLLSDKSLLDSEIRMIERISEVCPPELTFNMENMVKDVRLSHEIQSNFDQFLLTNPPDLHLGLKFDVKVLVPDYWPFLHRDVDVILPKEMMKCTAAFKSFHDANWKNRKLTWSSSMGTCTVIGHFEAQSFQFVVSPLQAALLLFNETEKLSSTEVSTQLRLTGDLLDALLDSLSSGSYKILIKNDNGEFEMNMKFRPKRKRSNMKIQIPPPRVIERPAVRDYSHVIDATVVRLMKKNKVMPGEQIVLECLRTLWESYQIEVEASVVNGRLENLTRREFMVLIDASSKIYEYVA